MQNETGSSLSLPQVVEVPRGAELLRIVGAFEGLTEMIPCGLAGCHTPHRKGYVVAFRVNDGAEGMVGHVYGSNFFGSAWNEAVQKHERHERIVVLRARALGQQPTVTSLSRFCPAPSHPS
jgi:hypothetical protein